MNQITERGQTVLREHPDRVDNHVLQSFNEFRDFKRRVRTAQVEPSDAEDDTQTVPVSVQRTVRWNVAAPPRETITDAIEENNAAVAASLLPRVLAKDPAFLEGLVLKVLTAMRPTPRRGLGRRRRTRGSMPRRGPSSVSGRSRRAG